MQRQSLSVLQRQLPGSVQVLSKGTRRADRGDVDPMGTGRRNMPIPPDWKKKLMQASITIDGEVLMASDAPPGHFHQPQGFSVSLQVEDPADAERRFKALAEGGTVQDAVRQDVLLQGIRHVRRQVRHSLDGQLPARGMRLDGVERIGPEVAVPFAHRDAWIMIRRWSIRIMF